MNYQELIISILTIIISSGVFGTIVLKTLDYSKERKDHGKAVALIFLEEIYPRYDFNAPMNKTERLQKLTDFKDEINSYKVTAYVLELHNDIVTLINTSDYDFESGYREFLSRYTRTVNRFRKKVGRYTIPNRVTEGDYTPLLFVSLILCLPFFVYGLITTHTWGKFITWSFEYIVLVSIFLALVSFLLFLYFTISFRIKRFIRASKIKKNIK